MYLKLSLINLKAKPIRTILTVAAIIISITVLTFLNSFQAGLKQFLLSNSIAQNPLTQINVRPKNNNSLGLLSLISANAIDQKTIDAISKINHVEDVQPQSTIKGISSLQIAIFGQTFQTDALIFGAPYQTIASTNLTPQQWQSPENFDNEHPIPALVSSRLLDLFNYSFAAANNLPKLNPEKLIGLNIDILLNKSTFFATSDQTETPRLRAQIVGFSPNVNLIGLTIPEQAIDQINQTYLHKQGKNYPNVLVQVDSVNNLPAVKADLEKLNLQATSGLDQIEMINQYFSLIALALNLINLVIFIICGLMIAHTFLTKVAERTKDIGIMRAIGASSRQIKLLFLTEAGILGFFSGIIGYFLAYLCSMLTDFVLSKLLADFQNRPDSFFYYQPLQFFGILLFSIVFCLVFAYIPAKQGAKLDPISALAK